MNLRELIKTLVGMGIFLIVISLIELRLFPDATSVSIGITTGVISGLFVLMFQKAILERGEQPVRAPSVTIPPEAPANDENRQLTYSTIILSYVATIVALAALGTDLYSRSGLPLLHLWIATFFLLIGGISFIYWNYGKNKLALLVGIVCFIGDVFVFILLLLMILNGIHAPTQITGNVTNICENCTTSPVTNIVNNYNVTVYENYIEAKKPSMSISELKYLMQNRPEAT
jgi:hypothetical protein